jgi:hypothetical protein
MFFFPYRGIGGVSVLFSRMATVLAEEYGFRTIAVDFSDGHMAKTLASSQCVRLVPFEVGQELVIGPDIILVMQSILPYNIRPELRIHPDTRIVFWTLHPFNLVQTIIPLPWCRNLQTRYRSLDQVAGRTFFRGLHGRLRSFVLAMAQKKSIFFMDGPTLRTTQEHLNLRIPDPVIVPVSNDFAGAEPRTSKRREIKGPIQFVWMGRLCDFKIYILQYAARRLSEIAARRRLSIELHVMGDGPESGQLEELHLGHAWFQLRKLGTMLGKERDEYLLHHADVLLGMGLSALEGAKLGIPTILLDFSYGPISGDYRFRWLFDARDCSLGEVITAEHYEKGNDSLNDLVNAVLSDYDSLAIRTFAYYFTHHSITTVCKKFVAALQMADFRYGSIEREVLQKSLVRRAYEFVRDDIFKKGVFAAKG